MLKKFKLNTVEVAVILAGGYIALQMMADIAATKVILVGPLVMDAGLIYILTFTWRDLIHKRLGGRAARLAIILAAGINLVMAGYFYLVIRLPPEPEWTAIGGQAAWEFIFGLVPRITIASILAEVVAELVDTEMYDYWLRHHRHRPQWTRVAASNGISIPLDSLIFVGVAFGGVLPVEVLITMFLSNIATKGLLTLLTFWMIYFVKEEEERESSPLAIKQAEYPT
jgi:hypothetical protein